MYSIKRERQLGFIYLYIHQVVSLAVNPKTNIKCPFKQNQYPKVRRSMSNLSHGLVLISLQCPGAGLLSSEAGQGPRNQVSDRFDSRSISVLTNAVGGRLQSSLLISERTLRGWECALCYCLSNLQEIALMFHFPRHRFRMKNSELSPHRSNERRRVIWAASQTARLPTVLLRSTC